MGTRKNQSTLTAAEKAAFVAAVKALKANGTYDVFVAQHRTAFLAGVNDPAHGGPAFLPWHREFTLLFERALGKEAKLDMQPMQPGDVKATYADTTALQKAVGFAPSTPLATGLARFAEWFKSYR